MLSMRRASTSSTCCERASMRCEKASMRCERRSSIATRYVFSSWSTCRLSMRLAAASELKDDRTCVVVSIVGRGRAGVGFHVVADGSLRLQVRENGAQIFLGQPREIQPGHERETEPPYLRRAVPGVVAVFGELVLELPFAPGPDAAVVRGDVGAHHQAVGQAELAAAGEEPVELRASPL